MTEESFHENEMNSQPEEIPEIATQAVLGMKGELPEGVTEVVRGYDFNKGVNYSEMFATYRTMGIQATQLHYAIDEIKKMIEKKMVPLSEEEKPKMPNPVGREYTNCSIFLGYTSNMISCGNREIIRYLAEHNMVDVIVTSGGGIEEDFMKCLKPHYIGDFRKWKGSYLRSRGVNRIGNMLVPNNNYCLFEDWLSGLLNEILIEQKADPAFNLTPSKLIWRMGEKINHPESVYYWCWKNRIPVFCPGITDGAVGDVFFFHSYKNPGLRLDVAEDVRLMNQQAIWAKNTGLIIIGGGIIKHHICNANMMRNGADHCVYINTALEYDCSDAGAPPDEAQSWGKIRPNVDAIKVACEASLILPIIVAETFAKEVDRFHELWGMEKPSVRINGD